ncbi:cell wall surface anchor family protein [Solidesulfovibrio carbinoliphilus subsp. oakridgensis]|uniref:Cell wall surface anchor family protein n=1 Tax=Solidesulfovibrio carbinoliphilus subsp. oakridgensis TaxID=694327 RepID=G7QC39_9BACT|nr:hypothetical protein [Solidesulfovibrio carbinoliphilus]EHJ49485.1 cell wall surface anchor family protein [Solidesulfovibrio carbinoliphilus subsp. oakridgensis]
MSITQTISPIPDPPSIADSASFDERAEVFLNALPELATELNAFGTQANSTADAVDTAAGTATTKASEAASSASTASGAASTAATKASEASASATTASGAAATATTKAGEAATSATVASGAATTATTKAGEAADSATTASGAASTATTKAGEASTSATAAAGSATTATTKAGEASSSATSAASAKTAAESARDTAVAAKDLAVSSKDTAVAAATTATTKAGEAADSATAAAASAAAAAEIAAGNIPNATTEAAGKVELATTAETQTGTDATRAVTPAGAAATFSILGHVHTGVYEPANTNIQTHISRTDNPHAVTAAQVGAAPAAKGVTNGDGHDHSGGDGAQISYAALADLPTIPAAGSATPEALGTAAAGTASGLSHEDHVHAMPTAAQVGALATAGGAMTGRLDLLSTSEGMSARGSISGAQTLDMALGNCFTATVTAATTFAPSNVPASGVLAGFVLLLTNGGAYTITWPTGTKWAGGTAPTLTTSGTDALVFVTTDGGTTWKAFVSGKDLK